MACDNILQSIALDCDNPLVGGVNDRLILFKLANIATVTYDNSNPLLVTGITLETLSPVEPAISIEGKYYSNDVKGALVKNDYSKNFDHEVLFRVFTNSSDVKLAIQYLVDEKVVAIVQNNFKATDSKYEIYGLGNGLEIEELTWDKSDTATNGAYIIRLLTGKYKEKYLPATLFDTDEATTDALVDALLA